MGQSLASLDQLGTISGTTVSGDGPGRPTIVVLYALHEMQPTMVNYVVQLKPGPFLFSAAPGRYLVQAFEDLDLDYVHSPGEPIGDSGFEGPIELELSEARDDLEIVMSSTATPRAGLIPDLRERHHDESLPSLRRNVGVITSLDDERFSSKSGREASMDPFAFAAAGGIGIFFLEAYDPERIPVLFVHGMNGSPQDLRALIEGLDRERFQAWFVAYPSSLRLDKISRFMHESMLDLGVTYDLHRLYVIAHSMGGLVSRDFINQNVALKKRELIRLFISIASPFGGESAAAFTESVPGALLPPWINSVSWVDMVPNSAFIRGYFASPLPDYVRHHLFFGYLPNRPDDGAVSIASQLDPRAEAGADRLHASASSHTTITSDPLVMARISEILEEAHARDVTALRPDRHVARTAISLANAESFTLHAAGAAGITDEMRSERRVRLESILRAWMESFERILQSEAVSKAIDAANADPAMRDRAMIGQRDRRWQREKSLKVANELTDEACNRALEEFVEAHEGVVEIIVTGETGGNVCQSGLSSDYDQSDEAWWTRTMSEGRIWHAPLAYDASADVFGVEVHVPIRAEPTTESASKSGPSGGPDRPIGVAKILIREP